MNASANSPWLLSFFSFSSYFSAFKRALSTFNFSACSNKPSPSSLYWSAPPIISVLRSFSPSNCANCSATSSFFSTIAFSITFYWVASIVCLSFIFPSNYPSLESCGTSLKSKPSLKFLKLSSVLISSRIWKMSNSRPYFSNSKLLYISI